MTDAKAAAMMQEFGEDLTTMAIDRGLKPKDCLLLCIIKTDTGHHLWMRGMKDQVHDGVAEAVLDLFSPEIPTGLAN